MGSVQEPQRTFDCRATSYLPASLLDFLKQSHTSNTSQQTPVESTLTQPPSKKRKRTSAPATQTEIRPIQYVVLRWTTINISFPKSSEESNVHFQNTQPIRIKLERKDPQSFGIRIHTVFNAQDGSEGSSTLLETELAAAELPLRDVELAMLRDKKWILRGGQAVTISLNWEKTETPLHVGQWEKRTMLQQCLDTYFPGLYDDGDSEDLYTPQAFYNCAHIPDRNDPMASSLKIPDVETHLYPFQKRAVLWLLRREGVQWSPLGLAPFDAEEATGGDDLPPSFSKAVDDQGTPFFISDEMKIATTDIAPFSKREYRLRGGILAEEMGLGKTLEIIALITLHKCPMIGTKLNVPTGIDVADDVLPVQATLLVVPSSLMSQWVSEIRLHSPSLSVYEYMGFNAKPWSKTFKSTFEEARQEFATHDVVITTYDVLSTELHFTLPAPERNMRNARKHERPTSPLPKCLFWRVCLDEAQMIQGGVSAAAQVAQMIPRVNAWGISGTPVKRGIADLHGLLIFLKYEPYASNYNLWTHLIHSPRNFIRCFNKIALRHTKQSVRDELQLPPQKRFVITMPFTQIEEHHYQSLFQKMATDCGVDLNGSPLGEDWMPNYGKMRAWLIRLRQTALHPEIGGHNRRALGRLNGPLRTLDEIVAAMLEQIDHNIRDDQRSRLISKLSRGKILAKESRVEEALELWSSVLVEAGTISEEIRKQLDLEIQSAEEIRKQLDLEIQSSKETSQTQRGSTDSDEEYERSGEESSKVGILRNRLRKALELEHMTVFCQANAYFQMKNKMSGVESPEFKRLEEKEVEGYARAKALRHEILQDVIKKVSRLISKINKKILENKLMRMPEISSGIPASGSEIRSALNKLGKFMDKQGRQILNWRDFTVKLLTTSLLDDEDEEVEVTGDEYEDSAETQAKVMVLVMALRTLISDRRDLLLGHDKNLLTETEVKTAVSLAKAGNGPHPQLTIELLNIRQDLKADPNVKSLRAILLEARERASELRVALRNGSTRYQTELQIVEGELQMAQTLLTEQTKIIQALEPDLELFTRTMNTRLEYYRQLQEVSDTVCDYEGAINDFVVNSKIGHEAYLERAIAAAKMKRRYFEHLQSQVSSDESWICVICQDTFDVGVFTRCGHTYCKADFKEWWSTHRNCPTCKQRLGPQDVHDILCKSQVLSGRADSDIIDDERGVKIPKKSAIYSEISKETLAQIKRINLGSNTTFTTKISTLAKHIIWLRQADPGSKSIVFSQYSEFLKILSLAFKEYGIGYDSITNFGGADRFKNDPSKEVFLLHARAHSSGLNLVNASHVFLCEPLLQTALELQAIARVDRIGQKQATTVWLYLIDGTVEQSIYDISVERRLEHLPTSKKGKSRETSVDPDILERSLEQANSMELQDAVLTSLVAANKSGGEVVPDDELWKCLFGSRKKTQAQAIQDGVVDDGQM